GDSGSCGSVRLRNLDSCHDARNGSSHLDGGAHHRERSAFWRCKRGSGWVRCDTVESPPCMARIRDICARRRACRLGCFQAVATVRVELCAACAARRADRGGCYSVETWVAATTRWDPYGARE